MGFEQMDKARMKTLTQTNVLAETAGHHNLVELCVMPCIPSVFIRGCTK